MCGGLVHPIAGRCKHCKADLASARTVRAPAVAVLPPLANPAVGAVGAKELPQIAAPAPLAVPPNAETLVGATPVQLASTAPAIVVEPAPARAAYNPIPDGVAILPPRPTGRMRARGGDERGWLARNWPVLVIILASIAILGAVILMVLPKSDPVDVGTKNHGAGPAPERMETNPLPPQSSDPWQNGQPPSANPPPQQVPNPPPDDPDDQPDDQTMIDPNDPLKDPFTNGGLGLGRGNAALNIMGNVAQRLCEKARTCADPTVATMCSSLSLFPTGPLPPRCPQAQKCMEMIDKVDVCDSNSSFSGSLGNSAFIQLMQQTSECVDALMHC